ncbi:4274_t:CDS:2, partial [Scutellospora calospora]
LRIDNMDQQTSGSHINHINRKGNIYLNETPKVKNFGDKKTEFFTTMSQEEHMPREAFKDVKVIVPLTPKPIMSPSSPKTMSLGRINISSLKDALNRPRNSRHLKNLSEMNISPPDINDPILFESKVAKWSSSTIKKSSNKYLILTRNSLCGFKNADKANKIFDGLPLYTIPRKSSADSSCSTDITNLSDSSNTKTLPAEHVILCLATVFAITEQLTPEPHIRIDYMSSLKKQVHVSITAPDIQKHRQWFAVLKPAIHNSDPIGSFLTNDQRIWIMNKLRSLDDLADENEKKLMAHRVLLKSLTDENNFGQSEKDLKTPVFLILGKNNIYIIPSNVRNDGIPSEENRKSNDFKVNNNTKNSNNLIKEIDFWKYKYPLLCIADIRFNNLDDTFQITFKNDDKFSKRTIIISSLFSEIIMTEIRSVIDSITFWWTSPSYKSVQSSTTISPISPISSINSPISSITSPISSITSPISSINSPISSINSPISSITSPISSINSPISSITSPISSTLTTKISQEFGIERMIEAQCHVFGVSKSRISFNVEYVLGDDNIQLGLGVDNLPFRFILLPPKHDNNGIYSTDELMAVFNSLKYHPLLSEVILSNINLFELQIQPASQNNEECNNMLGTVLYDLLISNTKLRKLNLNSCGITSETIFAIGNALITGNSNLNKLLISDSSITRECAQTLANGIKSHSSSIKELDISNCKLTHDGLVLIIQALYSKNPEELESLNISDNICDIDSIILTELLLKTKNLRTLNLRNCLKFFTGIKPIISLETLGEIQLTTLDLGGIPLNNKSHLLSLYAYIRSSSFSKVKYFSIDNCNLDGEALAVILSYITTSPNCEKIRVWAGGNFIAKTSDSCKEFCYAVRNDWTPIWLSLKDSIFGSNIDQVIEILSSFCENTVIKYLDLSNPQFFISNETITQNPQILTTTKKACEVIGKLFRSNKNILELNLQGNSERKWGHFLGAQLLKLDENTRLERLNIEGNSISDQGAKSLSEALKKNVTLKSLNIDDNEIGIDGYLSLHKVLTSRQNITLQNFGFPIKDFQSYNESLDTKLTTTLPITRTSQKIASEKQKINFKQLIDEILFIIEKNSSIGDSSTR